jgi:uncharacterized membrane protein YfcA
MVVEVLFYVAVGFLAQLVDGALGMAYGVTATTVLLHFNTLPAVASASVHAAEAFTTGASAFSHWRIGNVEWRLVVRLAVPGVLGGVVGAYLLSSFPGDAIRPFVSLYLLAMGGVILARAFRIAAKPLDLKTHPVTLLGAAGGFLDAVGGGGWGPIVASRLIGSGGTPRLVIGSVNCAEFFLTVTISVTFFTTIGLELWPVITGLIIGGVLAAPIGALLAARIPTRPLMILVGCLVSLLSIITLSQTIGDWL